MLTNTLLKPLPQHYSLNLSCHIIRPTLSVSSLESGGTGTLSTQNDAYDLNGCIVLLGSSKLCSALFHLFCRTLGFCEIVTSPS